MLDWFLKLYDVLSLLSHCCHRRHSPGRKLMASWMWNSIWRRWMKVINHAWQTWSSSFLSRLLVHLESFSAIFSQRDVRRRGGRIKWEKLNGEDGDNTQWEREREIRKVWNNNDEIRKLESFDSKRTTELKVEIFFYYSSNSSSSSTAFIVDGCHRCLHCQREKRCARVRWKTMIKFTVEEISLKDFSLASFELFQVTR